MVRKLFPEEDQMRTNREWDLIKIGLLLIPCLLLLGARPGLCLISVGHGNSPVQDAGWPLGAVEMANLPTRVGWWEGPPHGGGQWQFLYRCQKSEQFMDALKTFAGIRAPRLEIVLHDGPSYNHFLRKTDQDPEQSPETRLDWSFTVWVPENWHRAYNDPKTLANTSSPNYRQPVGAPRLDVYIGGGPVVFPADFATPRGVVLIDQRAASAPIKPVDGGLVQGDVYDMSTGKPIAGAEVILSLPPARGGSKEIMRGRSDALGAFRIEKIPAGHYIITIQAEGYAPREVGRYENAANAYHDLVVELARAASLKGTVTDLQGRPISQAKVYTRDLLGIDGRGYTLAGSQTTTSDGQGRFEISSLPIGFTHLRCQAASLHLTNSIFEIYPIPTQSIKLVMEGTGILRGRVVDDEGNVPTTEVHVHLEPVGERIGKWGGSMRCATDGSFQFTGVPPGNYWVSTDLMAAIEGDGTRAEHVSIKAGDTLELKIVHKAPPARVTRP